MESYLGDAQMAAIDDVMRRVWATQLAMQGGGTHVVFARWSAVAQDYVAIPAQLVTIQFANREQRTSDADAANVTTVAGTMKHPYPFDARPGDLFTIDSPQGRLAGKIDAVFPPTLGIQRAAWTLEAGGIG